MYIESVPNRNSPPAILLRESFRDGAKIKKRTIANLSDWPAELVEGLRTLLKGGTAAPADRESIIVRRALPHGHVAAVLGTLRAIGLDRILGPAGNRPRDLAIAMIVVRLIAPASKLATARMLDPATAASSLGDILGLGAVDEDELYAAIDWLGERQGAIEQALSRKHLRDGTLVLYDVASSYLEGRCCELARLGYNRDGKKGKLQIVYGLMCAPDGCPVAIEVFEGDTGDPATLAAQIDKIKARFALKHVVLVGDRGMITQTRIDEDIVPAGLDWITALRVRPSARWSRPANCSCRCSTGATLRRSPRPIIRASGSSSAATATSPPSAAASVSTCWPRPNAISPSSPPPSRAPGSRCAAKTRLASRSAPSSTATRWPSTSNSTSARRPLRSAARPMPSRPRRRLTASTWCAPTCPNGFSAMPQPSAPTSRLPRSSRRSARSRPSTSICGRSSTGPRRGCAATSCYACSPIMSSITCARGSPLCSTMRPITRPLPPSAPASSPRPRAPTSPTASRPPDAPRTVCRCTASKPSSPTSPPIAASRPPPPSTRNTFSPFTPGQLRSSNGPSNFSVSTRIVPSNCPRARDKQTRVQWVIDSARRKFGLDRTSLYRNP